MRRRSACGGCWGCDGCHGCAGAVVVPAAPAYAPAHAPAHVGAATTTNAPATVVVTLPADAKLMIDNHATTSTAATRKFVSPELTAGQDYSYTLKAELVRDGQTLTAFEKVVVRAGAEVTIDLPLTKFATPARVASK